jgi:hypothetical protein
VFTVLGGREVNEERGKKNLIKTSFVFKLHPETTGKQQNLAHGSVGC